MPRADSEQSDSRRRDALPPLAGVRVIDFGHYLPGPLAGMLLADQRAQVIRLVESADMVGRSRHGGVAGVCHADRWCRAQHRRRAVACRAAGCRAAG